MKTEMNINGHHAVIEIEPSHMNVNPKLTFSFEKHGIDCISPSPMPEEVVVNRISDNLNHLMSINLVFDFNVSELGLSLRRCSSPFSVSNGELTTEMTHEEALKMLDWLGEV